MIIIARRLPLRSTLRRHHLSPPPSLQSSVVSASHLHHHPSLLPRQQQQQPISPYAHFTTKTTAKMPSSLPPSFNLTPCTPSDIPLLSPSYYECFIADKGITHWFADCSRRDMEGWMKRRLASRMAEPTARHYKITDSSSSSSSPSLVAWARWAVPENKGGVFSDGEELEAERKVWGEEKARKEKKEEEEKKEGKGDGSSDDVPKGADAELMKGFLGQLEIMEEKWGADDMLTLGIICTSPDYRRRGAAAALLAPMLAIADAQGLPAYLESTPVGRPLYEKFGFRAVDDIVFDLTALTKGRVEGVYTMNVMIRDPQPLKQ